MPAVVLYHAENCHLCERALAQVRALQAELGFDLREVDIGGDPDLEAEYREWIPVVEIDGRRRFTYFVQPEAFRKAVAQADALVGGATKACGVTSRRGGVGGGSSDGRRRGAPVPVSPGADAGPEDGEDAHLLAGDRRVHEHQRDADPPRPLRLREVRQARSRLQHRLAARRDPQDPADAGAAQHRPHRRRPPRPGDRQLADLRGARHQHRRRPRHRPGEARPPDRQRHGQRVRAPAGARPRQEHHRRRARRSRHRRAGRGRRPRRRRRQDHLQLLRGAARDAGATSPCTPRTLRSSCSTPSTST